MKMFNVFCPYCRTDTIYYSYLGTPQCYRNQCVGYRILSNCKWGAN